MRLDEFSAPADIDGVFTTTEQIRFLSVGFDTLPGAPAVAGTGWRNLVVRIVPWLILFCSGRGVVRAGG